MDPLAIANTFISQYYQTFNTNKQALGALYVSFSVYWFNCPV